MQTANDNNYYSSVWVYIYIYRLSSGEGRIVSKSIGKENYKIWSVVLYYVIFCKKKKLNGWWIIKRNISPNKNMVSNWMASQGATFPQSQSQICV